LFLQRDIALLDSLEGAAVVDDEFPDIECLLGLEVNFLGSERLVEIIGRASASDS
jgi:hypothetical protein